MTEEEGLVQLVSAQPSVWEVPSSKFSGVTSSPSFDFSPVRVALSSFKYP